MGFDDNASFRQKAIFDMEDTTESDPREVEAGKYNLNYVQVQTTRRSFLGFESWNTFRHTRDAKIVPTADMSDMLHS